MPGTTNNIASAGAVAAAGAAAVAAGAGPQQRGAQPQQQQKGSFIGGIIRMIIMWYAISYFFKGNTPTPKQNPITGEPLPAHTPLWPYGQVMNMRVYLSENEVFDFAHKQQPDWREDNLIYAWTESNTRSKNLTIIPSENLLNNGSMYAHIFLTKKGVSPDPSSSSYDPTGVLYKKKPLVKYVKIKKDKKHNLIARYSEQEEQRQQQQPTETNNGVDTANGEDDKIVAHWIPTMYLTLVDVHDTFQNGGVPPHILPHLDLFADNPIAAAAMSQHQQADDDDNEADIDFDNDADAVKKNKKKRSPASLQDKAILKRQQAYYPITWINEFWLMRDHLIAINDTVKESGLPLYVEVSSLSATKWQLYLQFEQSLEMQESFGSMVESDKDEFKRMILETNPYLLATTVVVSLLHMIFDFLAFKNDISFWKNKKSMEGLSQGTIVMNFVSQFIIFLYLLDNDTSWMVLLSSGIGVVIEAWKIRKTSNVLFTRRDASDRSLIGRIIPWRIRLEDKEGSNYTQSRTREYDEQAMRYLSWILYPLLVGYSIYSLVYETHKSWYSWILSSLVGAIYTFGFIMMTPQLFINYKLKSVAHLPWRTFVYKALNTFIDDLFAFIIKMPTLHRLSCFRDDLIFLIYLYQRWVYPVDKKRVNEFGQGGEEEDGQQQDATTGTSASRPSAGSTSTTEASSSSSATKPAEAKKDD